MTRDERIAMGRQWLEHSPPADSNLLPDLAGFKGNLEVCNNCANRIFKRGCDMKQLADTPVWSPDTVTCDLH